MALDGLKDLRVFSQCACSKKLLEISFIGGLDSRQGGYPDQEGLLGTIIRAVGKPTRNQHIWGSPRLPPASIDSQTPQDLMDFER